MDGGSSVLVYLLHVKAQGSREPLMRGQSGSSVCSARRKPGRSMGFGLSGFR